jgi:hypothetical protein
VTSPPSNPSSANVNLPARVILMSIFEYVYFDIRESSDGFKSWFVGKQLGEQRFHFRGPQFVAFRQ